MTTSDRWTTISLDPNHPEVVQARERSLHASRRPPIRSRLEHLRSLAAGKAVLDVGVVEHFVQNERSRKWLHRNLVEVADRCVGVDILADAVEELQGLGYDVRVHDFTAGPLDEQFELVVLGEVIEHLGAPEPFLANLAATLAPGGRLVLTTPNPYMLNRAWHALRGRFPDSADHALLLGPSNIAELAGRAGLEVVAWRGVLLKDLPGWRNRVVTFARAALARAGFAAELGCDTLIYELERVAEGA